MREGEGVAARVLENMNVELAKVRTAVEAAPEPEAAAEAPEADATAEADAPKD